MTIKMEAIEQYFHAVLFVLRYYKFGIFFNSELERVKYE